MASTTALRASFCADISRSYRDCRAQAAVAWAAGPAGPGPSRAWIEHVKFAMAEDEANYDEDGNVINWEELGDDDNQEESLRNEEFDLYATLKLSKGPWENEKIESQSRAAYHRMAAKWHPSNFKSRPVICDVCSCRLKVGSDNWFHFVGDIYDVCKECHVEVAESEKAGYVLVSSIEDLGAEKETYIPELERQQARDDATKMFRRVALAYRVLGKDHELRQIYDTLGWQGLVKADVYAQESVFAINAFAQYDDFFAGVDEEDRQYLLLNGAPTLSHHSTCTTRFLV